MQVRHMKVIKVHEGREETGEGRKGGDRRSKRQGRQVDRRKH